LSRFLDPGRSFADRAPMLRERPLTSRSVLALAGVLQPIWFLGGSLLFGALRPGYEPLRDAISELGEQGASNALLWDVGGFGGMAVLYALYAAAIQAEFGAGLLFGLVALQAIATAGSGLFSCDAGCPPVALSTSGSLHIVFGLSYFLITTLIPFVAWRQFRARADWRSLARISLWTGTLLAALFLVGPSLGVDRVGAWQRADLLLAYAWQIAVAIRLYRLLDRPDVHEAPSVASG
jgi:hypothetical membrane protein